MNWKKWNAYKKTETPEDNKTMQYVDFEQSKTLLAEVIKKENEELELDADSEETRRVNSVELVFAQKWEEKTYKPVWYYEMEDGRTYYVDCMDGMVSHP